MDASSNKKWHIIDYILTRMDQRRHCINASVVKAANCWTDHSMVRTVIRLDKQRGRNGKTIPFAVQKLQDLSCKRKYQDNLAKALSENPHPLANSPEQNRKIVKSCVLTIVENSVGRGKKNSRTGS